MRVITQDLLDLVGLGLPQYTLEHHLVLIALCNFLCYCTFNPELHFNKSRIRHGLHNNNNNIYFKSNIQCI